MEGLRIYTEKAPNNTDPGGSNSTNQTDNTTTPTNQTDNTTDPNGTTDSNNTIPNN
jgi:hypothetical protein